MCTDLLPAAEWGDRAKITPLVGFQKLKYYAHRSKNESNGCKASDWIWATPMGIGQKASWTQVPKRAVWLVHECGSVFNNG